MSFSIRRMTKYTIVPACLTGLAMAWGGCNQYAPGGGIARDIHPFTSYPHDLKTISLIDTRTQETLWTMDVPIGKKIVVRFKDDADTGNDNFPAEMTWKLMPADQRTGLLDNSMPVPPKGARLLWQDKTDS